MNERVVLDPRIQHGKPVIRGTRVPIIRLLDAVAGGESIEEAADSYGVTPEDVRAAVAYVAEMLDQESHFPLMPVE